MNKLRYTLAIMGILISGALFAQKEIKIDFIGRSADYTEEGKACFEIVSADGDLMPRSVMENFAKERLPDGTYSYKAIMDLESDNKRTFYISAPLAIDQMYKVTGLKSKDYIKIRVTIPKDDFSITELNSLTPSNSSNAVYQFFANIPDMEITANGGLKFTNKGKNEASFYVYELTVPVKDTPKLTVSVKAVGYNEFTYEIPDVAQRVYGFFIFPKEECFHKNFELGNAYFRDGAYGDAVRYYTEASKCPDIDTNASLADNLNKAKQCETIMRLYINQNIENAKRLEPIQENSDPEKDGVDSVYWYRNQVIKSMRYLLTLNPSDKFCSPSEIQKREEDLLNSSRTIVGWVTDIEYQNQVLPNVVVYGSEDPNADKKKMVKLGQTTGNGKFKVKVPNRYKVLYFESGDENYNKPVRIDISNGERNKYHVQLQRKVKSVHF